MTRTTRSVIFATVCLASAASLPTDAEAQRRAVPRGNPTGSVAVPRTSPPFHYRSYYRPYYRPYCPYYYPGFYYPFYAGFYPGFYAGFGFGYGYGYGGYYPGYWGYGPYPGYWGGYYDDRGSARIQVTPREAEVFIDGYYVGQVDEFDGALQRLHVPAGQHELTVYHEGYYPIKEKVLFRRGATLKVAYEMQPLRPGDAVPQRPVPDPNARPEHAPSGRSTRPYTRDPQQPDRPYPPHQREEQTEFGTLSLRIQPRDAVVLVDGEEWDRPEGEDRFTIELPEGPHRLEVRKDGFRTYMRTVDVRRGQTITLNVSLTSGGAVALRGN